VPSSRHLKQSRTIKYWKRDWKLGISSGDGERDRQSLTFVAAEFEHACMDPPRGFVTSPMARASWDSIEYR